jgi:hypothetical protein
MSPGKSNLRIIMPNRILLCCVLLLSFTAGCADDATTLAQAHATATTLLQEAQTTRATLAAKLSTIPASDPSRANVQSQLNELDQIVATAQTSLPKLDAAAAATTQPAIDRAIVQAASAIPYGSLAVAVVGLIFGIVKHVQNGNLVEKTEDAEKAFEQVVDALDAALPTPTADQQAKVNAVLDSDVKAKVAAVRTA